MMHSPISVRDKKAFINWFLNHYHLLNRESAWILNYISHHDDILSRCHFVRHVDHCPRGLIITSKCATYDAEESFRFHKQHVVTYDPERSFHDIRLNREQKLYIQLNFHKSHQCPYYAKVLEENPFDQTSDPITQKQDQELTNRLLDHLLYNHQRKRLEEAIDQSLDQLDDVKFKRLSAELVHLINRFESKG